MPIITGVYTHCYYYYSNNNNNNDNLTLFYNDIYNGLYNGLVYSFIWDVIQGNARNITLFTPINVAGFIFESQFLILLSLYCEKKSIIFFSVADREKGTVNLTCTLQYMHVNVKNS